jgi:tetraacyldisaccharide 4'-kinase
VTVIWRWALLPLNPIYRGAVALRSEAYRRGWRPTVGLDAPVVSVGNLTFGGSGKTPVVIALVRDLIRRGRRPAVLTRGYKRTDEQQRVVIGPEPRQTVAEVGDEPLEMARRLPGVPIVVDADRGRGGAEAIRRGADVLVLDDGFQHLRLERDLDLVVLDAGDPWGGNRLPPLGRLREPASALARADAVLITKVPSDWHDLAAEISDQVRRIRPDLPILVARFAITRVRVPNAGWCDGSRLAGTRVLAFAGLGRPQGFADALEELGAVVVDHRWFPDHHPYTADDLDALVRMATQADCVLVTTGKDAVKLPDDAPLWVIEAEMQPTGDGWSTLWQLAPEVVS